jgi:trk system potassium uptake protein TrkA
MAQRILVLGLGRFGSALALSLSARGAEVVGVDNDPDHLEPLQDKVAFAIQADVTDVAALRSIEAARCEVAVVGIGEDFEANVLCVATLKELGTKRILARAHDARQARILRAVGATEVLEIETETGRRLARTLLESSAQGPDAQPAP